MGKKFYEQVKSRFAPMWTYLLNKEFSEKDLCRTFVLDYYEMQKLQRDAKISFFMF